MQEVYRKHSRYNVSNASHYPGSPLDIHRDISLTPLSVNEERGGSYKYIDVKKTQKQEFDLQTKLKQFNPTLHFTAVWFPGFLCCFFKFRNYNILTKMWRVLFAES